MDYTEVLEYDKKYIENNFIKIGSGSSRSVYDLGDGETVIKFIKSKTKGIAQNNAELNLYNLLKDTYSCLCPILYGNENVIIMNKLVSLTKFMKAELLKEDIIKIRQFKRKLNLFQKVYYNDYLNCGYDITQEDYDEITNDELYCDITDLIRTYNLIHGDIFRISSWGYREGEFYLLDYGFTKEVADKFYR